MYILKCPHCDQQASSFLKTYFWGYFPGNHPNRCQRCSEPIKYNLNSYFQCGSLFLVLLFLFGYLLNPVLSIFVGSPSSNLIVDKIPAIDILGLTGWLFEIAIVFLILFTSFEIPARFFGTRVFKKRWHRLSYNQSLNLTGRMMRFRVKAVQYWMVCGRQVCSRRWRTHILPAFK